MAKKTKRRTTAEIRAEQRGDAPTPVADPTPIEAMRLLQNKLVTMRNEFSAHINQVGILIHFLDTLSESDKRNFYSIIQLSTRSSIIDTLPESDYKQMALLFKKMATLCRNYSVLLENKS